MTREEAIQLLRLYKVNEVGEGELGTWYKGIDKDMREALDMAIEALSAEAEWVPCSERLPDTDVPVLVSDGVYVWEDELQEDYEDGKTIYWWDSQCSFDFNDTAWMPKPKPYKGDAAE